jgi:C4-dicarboxylate-specific signal transduction histidine kinase
MEVTIPIESSLVLNERINSGFILALILLFATLSISIIYLVRKERRISNMLQKRVDEKTIELQILNNQLQEKVNQKKDELNEKNRILIQQTRLAAMGEMVGSIAHQWRQPLNALSMMLSTLELKSEMGVLTHEFVKKQNDEGIKICNSMSQTINDFRTFFMPDKETSHFGIHDAFISAARIIDAQLQESGIVLNITEVENITIEGFENEFSQVILNILSNAKDAISQNSSSDERSLLFAKTSMDASNIYLEVFDSGGGISSDVLPCIFEPNFTTKHKMQGMGIGLYMAKQIIEKHMGGEIHAINHSFTYQNRNYTGAKFTLSLPKGESLES